MADARPIVLLVSPDALLREIVQRALNGRGLRVRPALADAALPARCELDPPDLALLDLRRLGSAGIDLCRQLQRRMPAPIVVMGSSAERGDLLAALDSGACDHLGLPICPDELLLRVQGALRQRHGPLRPAAHQRLRSGGLEIDRQTLQVWRNGQEVRLTAKERALLGVFVAHPERILPHRQLLELVWGAGYGSATNLLHSHIYALRTKLEEAPAAPVHLLTEHGLGYRFALPDAAPACLPASAPLRSGPAPALPSSSAVAPSAPRPPTLRARLSLPQQPTPLLGRAHDVLQVQQLLGDDKTRLLTLTGPAGIGKTRLAVAAAEGMLDVCPDGVFFVALAPLRQADQVLPAIAQVLGCGDSGSRSPYDLLVETIQQRALLLVLDNVEHVVEVAPQVADLLTACPQLNVLATSRVPLHLRWERRYPVPLLALPEVSRPHSAAEAVRYPAVALFIDRAQAVRPDFVLAQADVASVVAICAQLEGLPLAIELAAAHVPLLALAELRERLSNRLALLTAGSRDMPSHHQTLRDAIAWSYDLLPDAERQLYAQLGVFVGSWTLDAALAVGASLSSCGAASIEQLVLSLVDKNLVQRLPGSGRFRMLETIREYALEQLAARGGADCARETHATYYLALCESGEQAGVGADQLLWRERLELELDNIRAALGWLAAVGRHEQSLRMASSLYSFWLQGHIGEGCRWLEQLLASASQDALAGQQALRAKAIFALGSLTYDLGSPHEARDYFAESLQLYREVGDRQGMAHGLLYLGRVLSGENYFEAALDYFAESFALYRELDDTRGIAFVLNMQAGTLLNMGYRVEDKAEAHVLVARAEEIYHESLALCDAMGDTTARCVRLVNLGETRYFFGDYAGSAAYYEQGLTLSREVGDRRGQAIALYGRAHLAYQLADQDLALRMALEALQIFLEMGHRLGVVTIVFLVAALRCRQGCYELATLLSGWAECQQTTMKSPKRNPWLFADTMAAVQAALDPCAFDLAWQRGRALTQDEVVATILGELA